MKTNLLRNKEAEIEHPSSITGQLASFNDSLLSKLFQKKSKQGWGRGAVGYGISRCVKEITCGISRD